MSIPSELLALLKASIPSAGDNISPLDVPVEDDLPIVTYRQVSATRDYETHDGTGRDLARTRWQITCWARTYADADAMAEELIAGVATWHQSGWVAFVVSDTDNLFAPDRMFSRIVDVEVLHNR
jgi:hypothetical protein